MKVTIKSKNATNVCVDHKSYEGDIVLCIQSPSYYDYNVHNIEFGLVCADSKNYVKIEPNEIKHEYKYYHLSNIIKKEIKYFQHKHYLATIIDNKSPKIIPISLMSQYEEDSSWVLKIDENYIICYDFMPKITSDS